MQNSTAPERGSNPASIGRTNSAPANQPSNSAPHPSVSNGGGAPHPSPNGGGGAPHPSGGGGGFSGGGGGGASHPSGGGGGGFSGGGGGGGGGGSHGGGGGGRRPSLGCCKWVIDIPRAWDESCRRGEESLSQAFGIHGRSWRSCALAKAEEKRSDESAYLCALRPQIPDGRLVIIRDVNPAQDSRMRIAAIGFLNPAPLMWDFEHPPLADDLARRYRIERMSPSECAARMADGRADIGLSSYCLSRDHARIAHFARLHDCLEGTGTLIAAGNRASQPTRGAALGVAAGMRRAAPRLPMHASCFTGGAMQMVAVCAYWQARSRFHA